MRIIIISLLALLPSLSFSNDIIGSVTLAIGEIKTSSNRTLSAGDPIYFNETIIAGEDSKSQIILLDETVMMIGAGTELIIDEFVFDPSTFDGKILANIKQGSIKILSGKISEANPEDLIVETPAGTIGTRGTEFQAIVDEEEGDSKILLIGPGPNNTLGLRPGALEVANNFGSVILDEPFLFTRLTSLEPPLEPVVINEQDLQEFIAVLDARIEPIENEDLEDDPEKKTQEEIDLEIKEEVKEGLFKSGNESGSELVAKVIDIVLEKSDGGVTADALSDALGVSVKDMFGKEYQDEFDGETEENKIAIANGEFGDAIAMISRFGGADKGSTTYADLSSKNAGTYTYTANGINGAATNGSGSGTINSQVLIDFAAKTITQTVSGAVGLGSDNQRSFGSISQVYSYGGVNGNVAPQQNVLIDSKGDTMVDDTNFGNVTPQAGESDYKTSYVSGSSDDAYFLNHDFRTSNIELGSNVKNDPIAFAGHMNFVVENLDSNTDLENSLSFSRTGITPKKD